MNKSTVDGIKLINNKYPVLGRFLFLQFNQFLHLRKKFEKKNYTILKISLYL
jgi:tmRNA-binding protein